MFLQPPQCTCGEWFTGYGAGILTSQNTEDYTGGHADGERHGCQVGIQHEHDAWMHLQDSSDHFVSRDPEMWGLNNFAVDVNNLTAAFEAADTALMNMAAGGILEAVHEQIGAYADVFRDAGLSSGELGEALPELVTELMRLQNEAGPTTAEDQRLQEMLDMMGAVSNPAADGAGFPALVEHMTGIRKDLLETADEFGLTGKAAEALADEVLGIPPGVDIEAHLLDKAAREGIVALTDARWETVVYMLGDSTAADELMSAFITADRDTVVEFLGDESKADAAMDAFLSGDYETVAEILANDSGARRTIGDFTAEDWMTAVEAIAQTTTAERALNYLSRNRSLTLTVTQVMRMANTGASPGRPVGYATGGLFQASRGLSGMPGYSSGRLLPRTGLGTDRILGISSYGQPLARLDDGEFITRRSATEEYLETLHHLNGHRPKAAIESLQRNLPGYQAGGLHGGGVQPKSFAVAPPQYMTTLAAADPAQSGPRAVFYQTVNNPIRGTDTAAAQNFMAGIGFDPGGDWGEGGVTRGPEARPRA